MGKHKAMIATAAWLWNASLVKDINWKHSPNDDGEFSFEALLKNTKVVVLSESLSAYRTSSLDWSRINTAEKHALLVACWERIEKRLDQSSLQSKEAYQLIYKGFSYCLKSPAKLFPSSQYKATRGVLRNYRQAGVSISRSIALIRKSSFKKLKATVRGL